MLKKLQHGFHEKLSHLKTTSHDSLHHDLFQRTAARTLHSSPYHYGSLASYFTLHKDHFLSAQLPLLAWLTLWIWRWWQYIAPKHPQTFFLPDNMGYFPIIIGIWIWHKIFCASHFPTKQWAWKHWLVLNTMAKRLDLLLLLSRSMHLNDEAILYTLL
jgi:hypothetical protein